MFAGRVVEVGSAVTRYRVGDDVFGSTDHGAYAELLATSEDSALARMPATLRYEDAAAVPYGGVTALRFLRDLAEVKPGDRVLIVGAAGGVGRFAIQLAKHLGADVTALCRRKSFDLVRELGADRVIDRETGDLDARRYDVIFDTVGALKFARARRALTERGRYLSLILSVGLLLRVLTTRIAGGQRALFGIFMGERKDMEELSALMEQGVVRPVIARRFPLEQIADAHAAAGRSDGAVVVVTASG